MILDWFPSVFFTLRKWKLFDDLETHFYSWDTMRTDPKEGRKKVVVWWPPLSSKKPDLNWWFGTSKWRSSLLKLNPFLRFWIAKRSILPSESTLTYLCWVSWLSGSDGKVKPNWLSGQSSRYLSNTFFSVPFRFNSKRFEKTTYLFPCTYLSGFSRGWWFFFFLRFPPNS